MLEEDSERLYNMFGVLCHPLSSISMGQNIIWLVVEASEKKAKVSWDDEFPDIFLEKDEMFQTTSQTLSI